MSLTEDSNNTSPEPPLAGNEDDVGYKKPPKKSQFKPGQSGNPKGRPKGSMSRERRFEKHLNRKVSLSIDGKMQTLTARDMVDLSLISKAAKGSIAHIKLVHHLQEKYCLEEPMKLPQEIRIVFVEPPVYPPDDDLPPLPPLKKGPE